VRRRWQAAGLVAALGIVAGAGLALGNNAYYATVAFSICFWAIAAVAYNLSAGYAGDLSLGHGAFLGLGAYTSTLLYQDLGVSPWLGLIAGALLSALLALAIGVVAVRLRGPYFAIVTLAILLVLNLLASAFSGLTNGAIGISISGEPTFTNFLFLNPAVYVGIAFAFLVLVVAGVRVLARSRLGYQLAAYRENEDAAQSLGIPTTRVRVVALVLSAAVTAVVGSIQTQYIQFISPTSAFSLTFSIEVAVIAIIGGLATLYGPILGAILIVILGQVLAPLVQNAAGLDQVVYGVILIVVLLALRGGLAGLAQQLRVAFVTRGGLRARASTRAIESPPVGITRTSPGSPSHPADNMRAMEGPKASPRVVSVTRGSDVPEPRRELLMVQGVTRHFGGVTAVDNVTLRVEQGEIVGVIGPNGAGKSTLFHIVSGFLRQDSGSVVFDGVPVDGLSPSARAIRGLCRTFQTSQPFADLTVLENALIGAMQPGRSMTLARELAEDSLDKVGLLGEADHVAGSLSLGNRRRLELARAIATRPKMLLLDEVMGGLTPAEVTGLMWLVTSLRADGVTVILIEHIMRAIMSVSDRVIVMHEGRSIADGTPEAVSHDEAVISAYLGEEYVVA
jgi:branched-chain amino acid transport system permease protein